MDETAFDSREQLYFEDEIMARVGRGGNVAERTGTTAVSWVQVGAVRVVSLVGATARQAARGV